MIVVRSAASVESLSERNGETEELEQSELGDPPQWSVQGEGSAKDGDVVRETTRTFFQGKRPWSKIKDQVLGSYMTPYLSKVSRLNRDIILIDGFAGPGKFEDGEAGSPLIIGQAAEKNVRGTYLAIFVNSDPAHHEQLCSVMKKWVDAKKVLPILGTAENLLVNLPSALADQTVFIYLDPFGLRGCEFSLLKPFLERNRNFSTEILINLSVPIMHRLAARRAAGKARKSSKIARFHDRLTAVLGGDYWKKIMWEGSGDPDERATLVMAEYRKLLQSAGATFAGSCPVREKEGAALKYYITFCSRHIDALLLMNDIMCRAYFQQTHTAWAEDTLFAKVDWKSGRSVRPLTGLVKAAVAESPGKSREDIWIGIVQQEFMQHLTSEYRGVVKQLVSDGLLRFEDVKRTGRLNDYSALYPGDRP